MFALPLHLETCVSFAKDITEELWFTSFQLTSVPNTISTLLQKRIAKCITVKHYRQTLFHSAIYIGSNSHRKVDDVMLQHNMPG